MTHKWVAVFEAELTDEQVAHALLKNLQHFHTEFHGIKTSIIASIGCFRCEEPLTEKLYKQECKGEPKK